MLKEFQNTPESIGSILNFIASNKVKFVEFKFIDLFGNNFSIVRPSKAVDKNIFENGIAFDGSSIKGWKHINNSDTIAIPDASKYFFDSFVTEPTIVVYCYILDECGTKLYSKDPRSVAFRAEQYLKKSGIADTAFFGPELEFFIFDRVLSSVSPYGSHFIIESVEFKNKNNQTGYEIDVKNGYFACTPHDTIKNMMYEMSDLMEKAGLTVELFHREVASAQAEIGIKYDSLINAATNCYIYKHIVKNVASKYGKTATFMPKPIFGDNGSGMHIHQSLWKDGKNLFIGDKECGLSEMALYYIGGIIKYGKALNAFCNPSTNSYKRLVPGFEAPVILAYSACNRSASIRIPIITSANAKRIETRFPDPSCNSYLAMSALMIAGLQGIKNKINPGHAAIENLYELPDEDKNKYPVVATDLWEALETLDKDRAIFTESGVFTNDLIDTFIACKKEEYRNINMISTPIEFEKYYTC